MPKLRKSNDRQRKRRNADRRHRKLCRMCQERPALFIMRIRRRLDTIIRLGKRFIIKTDKDHDLCIRCKRSITNSMHRGRAT